MATSAQLKGLFKSFANDNEEEFYTYALQISAHEARLGHSKLAKELRDFIDGAKKNKDKIAISNHTLPIVQPKGELAGLLSASFPNNRFSEMILTKELSTSLGRIIKEQRHIAILNKNGLHPRRKILLLGPPGTGKTMTASALAGELNLPLFVIRLEGLLTKYMGETAAKLRLVFDAIEQHRGVYLFDEFDSIGTTRTSTNDVGEIRRILNSFLQFIDKDDSQSIILAATNHPSLLDYALYRRFDDVLEYKLPSKGQRAKLIEIKLAGFLKKNIDFFKLEEISNGLSHAEICRACEDTIKEIIINNKESITQDLIIQMLKERQKYQKKVFEKLKF